MVKTNKDFSIKNTIDPYPIWIIDNLFSEETLKKILDNWPIDGWHAGYISVNEKPNILESGMRSISKYELMPEYIQNFVKELHSQEFTKFIEELTQIKDLIPDESLRWSGLRTMLPGSFQLIHSDARQHPENGLRKELTCLLYLNKDYNKERDQGCLEIWDNFMTACIHQIEPLFNRLVIFLNSDTAFHGVPNVITERKMITFSILKKAEATKRSKALFVARPCDTNEVTKQGIERSL